MSSNKTQRRQKIRRKIRKKVIGSLVRPRLSVYRSNKEIYAQLIDDEMGHTLASASSRDAEIAGSNAKIDKAKSVGQQIANRALAKGFDKVVFDRGGYLYHGRVKALAEGAREGGLIF